MWEKFFGRKGQLGSILHNFLGFFAVRKASEV
jgi:hypothetical protein